MPLMKVKYQNWLGNFSYAPTLEDGVINTDEVTRVVPCDSRGEGPWVKVYFRDGESMICRGTVDDFVEGAER